MRTVIAIAASLFVLPLLVGQTSAQERYRLERTENGYVRMDTQTGVMSLCVERTGELVCETAVEAQSAPDTAEGTLNERLSKLEERVEALEQGGAEPDLSVEQEFEQAMGMMERFFRRFMDMVQGFEQEREQTPQNGETAQPDQT